MRGRCALNVEAEQAHADKVAVDQASAELERLLADSRFKVTDRNRAFLRYIANESLSRDSKGVKAYSVAIDVFGRPSDFDPNIDPIVRIEATRLRASLDQYYEAYGADLPIRIHLPRGHYIAEFSCTGATTPPEAANTVPDDQAEPIERSDNIPPQAPKKPHMLRYVPIAAAGLVLSICILAAMHYLSSPGQLSSRPTLKPVANLVVMARSPADKADAEKLEDELLITLVRFGTLRVYSKSMFGGRSNWAALPTLSPPSEGQYDIILKYGHDDEFRSVSWQLVETMTGQTRASGEERVALNDRASDQTAALLTALGQHFGAAVGELNTIELARTHGQTRLGNSCVLEAESAISMLVANKLEEAAACLEATLKNNPDDADASAVLSRILMIQDYYAGNKERAPRSLRLAEDAVTTLPSSDRALIARIVSLYAVGRHEEAIRVGRDAVSKNPYNKDLASVVAFRMFVAGNAEEGVQLVRKAGLIDGMRPRNALIVLAMAAYCDGRPNDAIELLEDVTISDRLVQATRIAALVRLDRRSEAIAALRNAIYHTPKFSDQMERLFRTHDFNSQLGGMLRTDLSTAAQWYKAFGKAEQSSVN